LKYGFRSDLFLPKITCPVLILHGTKDRIVPYRSAIELYNCASPKQNVKMITIPGGRHNNLNAFPLFVDSLRSFLSE
jgi:alpha-beta hydrolase superfamily lysophospholipase